jgi:AAA domain
MIHESTGLLPLTGDQQAPESTTSAQGTPLQHRAQPLLALELLLGEDEAFFSEQLPDLVKANGLCPHDTALLWRPEVLARLCALSDPWFTSTVLTLAQPEYVGLDLLFDERLLPRLAAIRNGHLRGTFLPYARRLPGFDARGFLRELHRARQHQQAHRAAHGTPVVVRMDTVQATPVTWLWWPYIALGKLTMLDGDPGIGKSLLMTQLAANLSRGNPLPDQEGRPTLATGGGHTTVMLSTEDGLADTLKPRLEAAGADSSKIHVLTGWVDADGATHAFSFQDMPLLERVLQEEGPRLVIIDPIQAYLGSGVDMHRANETRPLLEALRRLAEQYQCAIVCLRHPAKSSQGGKALHRGLGSVDFIGAARTGLFVEQHPTDPTIALLAQSKSNIGPLGRTQMFTKDGGQFAWCGVSRLSAEMLAGSGRGPDPYAFLEAVCWLEERLADGLPVASEVLRAEADEEGLSFPTLRRAKKALGVRSLKRGDQWDWHLQGLRTLPPPTLLVSLASLEALEHLQGNQAVSVHSHGYHAEHGGSDGPQRLEEPPGSPPEPREDGRTAQVVETLEDAQEAHEAQEDQVTQQASVPPPTNGIPHPAPGVPCVVCGGAERWNDRGILRCVACWPTAMC